MSRLSLIQARPGVVSSLRSLLLSALCLVVSLQQMMAADTPAREDLLTLLRDRNIFDPNRRAPRRGEEDREAPPPARMDAFRLIGALTHDDKAFGFFDGTDSDYRRVVAVGEVIAGFKVTAINTTAVTLENDGKQLLLAIGTGLRRVGAGEWTPADGMENSTSPVADESADRRAVVAGESTPAGVASEEDDILQRMLERRRQEGSR